MRFTAKLEHVQLCKAKQGCLPDLSPTHLTFIANTQLHLSCQAIGVICNFLIPPCAKHNFLAVPGGRVYLANSAK